MQYLSWAGIQIPVAFVTGLSMKKTAKTVEHTGGYISSRGFEGAEMSCQVEVTRARCMAMGMNFAEWYAYLENLVVEKDGEAGGVTLGGYPLYPELKFALTNKNTTKTTDMSSAAPMSIACDLVLSGVECVKEVFRQRTLEFSGEPSEMPKISLTVNGKKLAVQDSIAVSKMEITPASCEIELCMGSDRNNVNREAFLNDLVVGKDATVTLGLADGDVVFHIIMASLNNGILRISGSFYSETANQTLTECFEACDLADVIRYLCDKLGIDANVQVNGAVDYYRLNGTPLDALGELQQSAGFVVSAHLGRLTFAFLPESVHAQKTLEGLAVEEDSKDELISGVVWRDGEHEATVGDDAGEILKVDSVFRSGDAAHLGRQCLKRAKYNANALVVSGDMDVEIRHHSQVAIPKDTSEVVGMVDFYIMDYVSNEMRLEVHQVV
jgi:hypothetical protein